MNDDFVDGNKNFDWDVCMNVAENIRACNRKCERDINFVHVLLIF